MARHNSSRKANGVPHVNRLGPATSPSPFYTKLFFKILVGALIGFFVTLQFQFLLTWKPTMPCKPSQPFFSDFLSSNPVINSTNSQDAHVSQTKSSGLIFVGVMTAQKYLDTRALAIYNTWGKLVPGKMFFFAAASSNTTSDIPIIKLPNVDDSYPPQKKSFLMLKYMWEHYGDRYEWFMRADDDVYVRTDKLEAFLRTVNSSKPQFIGQAGKGIQEEFGLLSLEYDENFCMGGPGVIFSKATLALVAPNVKYCLHNLYTTHEDVELGRCVQKFAKIPCTWSYEMQNIFYHNSSGRNAFTGKLKSREVHRAITLHPVKQHQYLYKVHNYMQSLKVQDLYHEHVKLHRELSTASTELQKYWPTYSAPANTNPLGLPPILVKYRPQEDDNLCPWDFFTRSLFSFGNANPRKKLDSGLKEGLEDIIREVMEYMNTFSRERGRVVDFKEVLYGYKRVDPLHGADYVLDILLLYKKYRGKKMTVPVRRHAYLQQAFGALQMRQVIVEDPPVVNEKSRFFSTIFYSDKSRQAEKTINLILPLAGRVPVFERFLKNYAAVCLTKKPAAVQLIVVLYRKENGRDEEAEAIERLVQKYQVQFPSLQFKVVYAAGKFARAAALDLGAQQVQDDNLLFFIDVDMLFTSETLHRVRTHTIQYRQVYFPVVFSHFDPTVTRVAQDPEGFYDLQNDHGYWRHFGFGIVSLYKSDLRLIGGLATEIQGWGAEDVDLFDKAIKSNITVFRAVDPGLVHVYHVVECEEDLETKQKEMCEGTRTNTYGSVRALAQMVREHNDIFYITAPKRR